MRDSSRYVAAHFSLCYAIYKHCAYRQHRYTELRRRYSFRARGRGQTRRCTAGSCGRSDRRRAPSPPWVLTCHIERRRAGGVDVQRFMYLMVASTDRRMQPAWSLVSAIVESLPEQLAGDSSHEEFRPYDHQGGGIYPAGSVLSGLIGMF